jgi:hypothetical protein
MEVEAAASGCWKWTSATYVLTLGHSRTGTFSDFIQNLPPWERELLVHTTMEYDAYAIGVVLEHGIRAVSDGSEWFKKQGSFGWIMSSDTGERVAIGMGPARGSRPNSYWSEGYGMLAMLLFLQRLAEFIQLHEAWKGIIATDSKSLIDTIRGTSRTRSDSDQLRPYRSTST